MNIYTVEQALEYLGISRQALYKYIRNPQMPIAGTKVHERARIFTQGELDNFKQFMQTGDFYELTRPGRRPDDPITKTIIEDGEKKRINLRSRSRGRTSRTRSRRETD